jgi:hypothetical protein
MRRRRTTAALAVAAMSAALWSLAGCGDTSADLFAVTRSPVPGGGAPPSTPTLTIVARDDGTVTCDGRRRALPGSLLLDARQLQRDLASAATHGVALAPGPRPVYRYSVRTPAGRLRFADDSPHQPNAFQRVAYFMLQVEQRVCAEGL